MSRNNGGRTPNYEPNSFDGPRQSDQPVYAGLEIQGLTGSYPWVKHPEDTISCKLVICTD